jgi:hypothetical protein
VNTGAARLNDEDLGCAAGEGAEWWVAGEAPEGAAWNPLKDVRLVGPIATPGPLRIFKRSDLLVGRISRVAAFAKFDNFRNKDCKMINSAPCDMTGIGAVHSYPVFGMNF